MPNYRVNKITQSPNNDHEVHKEGCIYWPTLSFIDLGQHQSCESAVAAAKVHFKDANGCKTCSASCHKG